MAMRQKGAIAFGLVYIPVELYSATQDEDIRFNQLTKDGQERVRYIKTCAGCKKELKPADIVKGFQYETDKYVVVTDEDFEKIKTQKDRSIQILQFSDLEEIPPVYFEKSYLMQSEKGGEKAFELLRQAMLEESKVAIGRTVMGTKESIVALIATEEGILLETLYFYEEVRQFSKAGVRPKADEAEKTMARQLIEGMTKHFDPTQYRDEYQAKLRELIRKKIEGKEIVVEKEEQPNNVISLMDALQQSLEKNKASETPAKKTRSKAKSR